jgi:hypothetical protein
VALPDDELATAPEGLLVTPVGKKVSNPGMLGCNCLVARLPKAEDMPELAIGITFPSAEVVDITLLQLLS